MPYTYTNVRIQADSGDAGVWMYVQDDASALNTGGLQSPTPHAAGDVFTITGGTGWTPGAYTVSFYTYGGSVDGFGAENIFLMSGRPAANGATGGIGYWGLPGAIATPGANTNTQINATCINGGGTAPFTFQWYRSTTPGFTPGGGNILSGQNTSTLADTTAVAGTGYYYKCVTTDATSAASNSNELYGRLWLPKIILGDIGDSITTNGAFTATPAQLQKLRAMRQVGTSVNQGSSATKVGDWLPGVGVLLSNAISAFNSAGVTHANIMLGTNDAADAPATSPASIASGYAAIAAALLSGVTSLQAVIVHAPPYVVPGAYGYWSEASVALLKSYIPAIMGVANGTTILAGDSLSFDYIAAHPELLGDSLHPNSDGNAAMALIRAAAIDRALNPGGGSRAFAY